MLLSSLIALGLLALAFGLALGYAAIRFNATDQYSPGK